MEIKIMDDFLNYNLSEIYENIKLWHILLLVFGFSFLSAATMYIVYFIRKKSFDNFKKKVDKKFEKEKAEFEKYIRS
jgi:hypothetical protein